MMKAFKGILLMISCLYGLSVQAQESLHTVKFPGEGPAAYFYRDTVKSIEGRFSGVSPFFLVYPDTGPADSESADRLISSLGLDSLVRTFSGSVCVMTPADGKSYDKTADLQAFRDFCSRMRVFANLKVIGLGSGASFVNAAIAANAGPVAGIASIGGSPARLPYDSDPVPAFIAGKGAARAAASYIAADEAVLQDKSAGLSRYANLSDSLKRVVVCTARGLSDRELVKMAWDEVLSRNYRINNYAHTWYMGSGCDEFGPGELAEYLMTDRIGVERRVKVEDITGTGDYLWYEYHPAATLDAATGSVPLVILLHGNNNDPRTQAETSGFVELAAREGFVVAELEWQGNGYAVMGLDGIEQVVYHLLDTYPQLDASRVYAEGLSAGSLTATGLGIRKSHVFAAVGAHSAGIIPGRFRFGYDFNSILNEARQKRGAVRTAYFSVTGKCDSVVPYLSEENWEENSFFRAWVAYQTLNGLEVSPQPDFRADSTFGIRLENRRKILLKDRYSIETGDLVKDGMPLMRLNTINEYGHWNFKPDAEMMWDYFKHFRRDPLTKELIYDAQTGEDEIREALRKKSSVEVGPYTVTAIREGVYGIEDSNSTNPAGVHIGAEGAMAGMNNCSNMYMVVGGRKAVLIDLSNDVKWADNAAQSLRSIFYGLAGEREKIITVTHAHPDHVGMAHAFADDESIELLLPRVDFAENERYLKGFPQERVSFFDEGRVFDLGGYKLNTVMVPGHTRGSMVFVLEGENIIFSGDALGSGSGCWLFSEEGFKDFSKGIGHLIEYIENPADGIDASKLVLYGGHDWQRGALPVLDMQYVLDMRSVVEDIERGEAVWEKYELGRADLNANFKHGTGIITWNSDSYKNLYKR